MAADKKEKLTHRELRFIEEYLIDLNCSEAVLRAGYKMTKTSAYVKGHILLKKDKIQAEIAKRQSVLSKKLDISQEKILMEFAKIAFSNIGGLFDPKTGNLKRVDQMNPDDLSAVAGISIDDLSGGRGGLGITTKKVRMYDKIRALERLGQHLGMFKEKGESAEDVIKALKELVQDLPD